MGGIIIATIAIIFAFLGARVWTRVIRPELRPIYEVFGDVVEVPQEMRTATRKGGGERAEQERPSAKPDTFARHVGKTTKP